MWTRNIVLPVRTIYLWSPVRGAHCTVPYMHTYVGYTSDSQGWRGRDLLVVAERPHPDFTILFLQIRVRPYRRRIRYMSFILDDIVVVAFQRLRTHSANVRYCLAVSTGRILDLDHVRNHFNISFPSFTCGLSLVLNVSITDSVFFI